MRLKGFYSTRISIISDIIQSSERVSHYQKILKNQRLILMNVNTSLRTIFSRQTLQSEQRSDVLELLLRKQRSNRSISRDSSISGGGSLSACLILLQLFNIFCFLITQKTKLFLKQSSLLLKINYFSLSSQKLILNLFFLTQCLTKFES